MNPMKEEYLEIEEIEYGTPTYKHILFEPSPIGVQQVQGQKDQSRLTIDIDVHDDDLLKKLLNKFQMSFIYPFLKDADITYRSLRYLSVEDINAAIHSVGYRAEFREKLFAWRRKKYATNDLIIENERTDENPRRQKFFCPSTPVTPIQNKAKRTLKVSRLQQLTTAHTNKPSPVPSQNKSCNEHSDTSLDVSIDNGSSKRMRLLHNSSIDPSVVKTLDSLNIEELLNESLFGSVIKEFYEEHRYLERKHRDVLILTIVDYVITNGIKVHCADFSRITNMIVNAFPSESDSRDYYFVARQGKRNPMGRLYTKYYNSLKSYRMRNSQSVEGAQSTETAASAPPKTAGKTLVTKDESLLSASSTLLTVQQNTGDNTQSFAEQDFEVTTEEDCVDLLNYEKDAIDSIKTLLRCDTLDWIDVKTMWSKSYANRYHDILRLPTKTILQDWPKYLNSNAVELFDIDFQIKYSASGEKLLRKWEHFETMIFKYYKNHMKCNSCMKYLNLYKSKPGKDIENYIMTVLLNTIFQPNARYPDSKGNYRQISIIDAVDLFAIQLNSLNELEKKYEFIAEKYNDIEMDLHPKIILVGDVFIGLQEIYVQFQTVLYEMPDFLSALDTCMKIFLVLNLPYPNSNVLPWTFIQQYFYEIRLNNDTDNTQIDSLIQYLKS